jgi:hypothetical protein
MRFNSSLTCAVTGAVARGCIQAASPPANAASRLKNGSCEDDNPPFGRGALSRGFCEVGVRFVFFNLKTDF